MENKTGVWIDSSKVIIVKLSGSNENITEIESDIENRIYHEKEGDKGSFMGSRHINNENKFEGRKKNQTDSFLKNVVEQIKNDDELYVFGPAEIKTKLKQYLEKEENNVIKKLKSVETADSMTLNQVVAKVKKFYNS